MTNFVTEYIRDFWRNYEMQYISDPFLELSDYHLWKIVFTGDKINNLSRENQREIYEQLQSIVNTIGSNEILVVSLKQWVGTKDPLYTLYTFQLTIFQIKSTQDNDTLYELNPAGIPKKIIQTEEREMELRIKNSRENHPSKSQILSWWITGKIKKLFWRE